ncbi:response regulator [bacterium]|nr:response regulator [bacterium]
MGGGKVLVVEDEPVIGELIRDILELHHYETQLASTGKEGLFRAEDWQPDAVILDLMLPDIDGFEVCRAMRSILHHKSPGVLMLTGLLTYEGRLRGFRAGADRFLLKPFQVPDLVRQLESIFSEYKAHRQEGLRHQIPLVFQSDGSSYEQVQNLMLELARSTPLSPTDIESVGAAIVDLGRRVTKWSIDHELLPSFVLHCLIYRDRLECHLGSAANPESDEALRWQETIRRRFQSSSLAIDHALGDISFSDSQATVITRRMFTDLLNDSF